MFVTRKEVAKYLSNNKDIFDKERRIGYVIARKLSLYPQTLPYTLLKIAKESLTKHYAGSTLLRWNSLELENTLWSNCTKKNS